MSYQKIVISSGHGLKIRGASGVLDEVDQARRMVDAVAERLRARGALVDVFHDDTSETQDENLTTIVNFHNSKSRQLDASFHFNAFEACDGPMGTEVCYKTQSHLAEQVSAAISKAGGLKNRGPKYRNDLYFLNKTNMPSVLLETCFVDSQTDADLYNQNFEAICDAIAGLKQVTGELPPPPPKTLIWTGKCSSFGGPTDSGVSPDEGLAFIYELETAPYLFLPNQPPDTTGLARRLNGEEVKYLACRWDYTVTPREMLLTHKAIVRVPGGIELTAWPADWGPHTSTGRVADLSPCLMRDLGLKTDDEVEVIFPA